MWSSASDFAWGADADAATAYSNEAIMEIMERKNHKQDTQEEMPAAALLKSPPWLLTAMFHAPSPFVTKAYKSFHLLTLARLLQICRSPGGYAAGCCCGCMCGCWLACRAYRYINAPKPRVPARARLSSVLGGVERATFCSALL